VSDPAVLAIVGATGVGKSDVAIALAQRLGGEIINADSMQLYRGMDIGTAKVPLAQRQGIAHHLLDVWDVTVEANVALYQSMARRSIAEIHSRGRLPILVGGSGLYVNAAIDDLQFPGHDRHIRARLQQQLDEVGPGPLYERLQNLDPQAAAAVLPSNGRRIIRALEVYEITGTAPRTRLPTPREVYPVTLVGLQLPRAELDYRLAARVERMWLAGVVEEVQQLRESLQHAPTARFALGYRQILAALAGECTEDEAKDATIRATRKFARRQTSWFGRDQRVRWFDADDEYLIGNVVGHCESSLHAQDAYEVGP